MVFDCGGGMYFVQRRVLSMGILVVICEKCRSFRSNVISDL